MRIVAKTAPMRQWEVARELRARVKAALDMAGVAPAGPDTIVITAPPSATTAEPSEPPAPRPAAELLSKAESLPAAGSLPGADDPDEAAP